MVFAAVIRLALGLMFALSGAAKIARPRAFERAVREYRLLPEPLVKPVTVVVPVLEAAVSVVLLGGLNVRSGLIAASALLVVFSLATAASLTRGAPEDCGCLGGVVRLRMDWLSVTMNLALAAAALIAAGLPVASVPLPVGHHTSGQVVVVSWMCAVVVVVGYWLLLIAKTISGFVETEMRGGEAI